MGWVDLLIVVAMAAMAMIGFRRGLLRQLVELAGLIFGVFLALYLTGGVVENYTGPAAEWRITPPLVFIGIVGLAMLLAQVIGRIVSEILQVAIFGWFDQVGGALAGAAKGALWLSIVITVILHMDISRGVNDTVRNSTLAPPLAKLLPAAFEMVEAYARDVPLREPFRSATR
ncbi:MAG: CvpA family protein [Candidatus Latescibacterota bacterium]|nr:MAG: CvpA family protein [Candidatus Latescibacterota bacterium]